LDGNNLNILEICPNSRESRLDPLVNTIIWNSSGVSAWSPRWPWPPAIQVAVGNWLCAQTPGHLKGPFISGVQKAAVDVT